MPRSTVIFLVLLRLAIGWHFLVEGYYKIQSQQIGETVYNKPFSSAGYFREAAGPLGSAVRRYAGDADRDALARLTVQPIPDGKDPATYPPQDRVPQALKHEWTEYLNAFASHYALDENQRKQAEAVLTQSEAKAVEWLTYQPPPGQAEQEKDPRYADYTSEQTHTYPSGDVKRRMTVTERLTEYRTKLNEVKSGGRANWAFFKDVESAKTRTLKGDLARIRSGLLADLDKQTETYKASLDKVLTTEQRDREPVTIEHKKSLIDRIDDVTPYALTAMGLCMVAGLFSRLASFGAAVFLLMTYLAVPAFPWLPTPPQIEGNYFFVNKNLVEMLAAFVLVTVPTGRWFGIDALFSAIGTLFRRKRPAQA